MIRAGIIGVTGYTGLELLRILKVHPKVEVTMLISRKSTGRIMNEMLPYSLENRKVEEFDPQKIENNCDVVFMALPSGVSYELTQTLKNVRIIDLSADFRFDNPEIYKKWYSKDLGNYFTFERVYGLPEIHRDKIRVSRIVGNPGCYPTSVLIALAPLLKNNLLIDDVIFVDSKSGVSGAGKKETLEYSFSEVDQGLKPYGVIKHRHVPEMEQEIQKLSGQNLKVVFTPHLVPMVRGILSTIYVKTNLSLDETHKLYKDFYNREKFIHVLEPGVYPTTKWTYGSNHVFISLAKDERTNTLVLMSALDNLVKGAAGQAVQNMNIMFSIDECTGLDLKPIYP